MSTEHDQVREAPTGWATVLQTCPTCGWSLRVHLVADWQRLVIAGEPVPIIGCGSPWHYVGLEVGVGVEAVP